MFSNGRAQLILPEKQSVTSGVNSPSPPSSYPHTQLLRTISGAMTKRVVLKRFTSHMPQFQAVLAGSPARLPVLRQICPNSLGPRKTTESSPSGSVSYAECYFGQAHELLSSL